MKKKSETPDKGTIAMISCSHPLGSALVQPLFAADSKCSRVHSVDC